MGSIVNKHNTSNPVIYPESSVNETDVQSTNESIDNIDGAEKGVNESELINQLEQDGYDKLNKLRRGETIPANATNEDIGDALLNIIKSGANDFEKKTGRRMTYAEMRYAYG